LIIKTDKIGEYSASKRFKAL